MSGLTENQVKKYTLVNTETKENVKSIVELLEATSKEFNLYSNQNKSDIDRGVMKKGAIYVPIKTGTRDLFEDHYPLTYIENIAVLLDHINNTESVLAKWLLTRTIIETIYRYAQVSLTSDTSDKKVRRFRALMVLDFHLHLATLVKSKKWIDEYFELLLSYKKRTETFKTKDFNYFPETRATLIEDNTEALRRERVRHLINLASQYFLKEPTGYNEVYDNTSRLIHGNPYQTSVARKLQGQWRERFLIYGLVIKSSDDLLQTITNYSNIKDATLVTRLKDKSAELHKFYLDTLKPSWEEVSKLELNSM